MPEPLTTEEAKNLLSLCRAGKLYDVEKWIAGAASPINSPSIHAEGKVHHSSLALDLQDYRVVEFDALQ